MKHETKNTKEQSPQSVGQNLSDTVLLNMGIEKDNYPADACFGEDEKFPLVGTYSKDRQTVCIMIADNPGIPEPIIPFDVMQAIAYTGFASEVRPSKKQRWFIGLLGWRLFLIR